MKQKIKNLFDLAGLTTKQTYDPFSKCWRSEPIAEDKVFETMRKNHNIDDDDEE